MKIISDNSNSKDIKLNIFERFKFNKCQNIKFILNKNISFFNKLSNDLQKFNNGIKVPIYKSIIQPTNYKPIDNNKRNHLKLFKKKKISFKYENLNIINSTNSLLSSKNNSSHMVKTTKKVSFENRAISPISKKKIINIKYLKNHLINQTKFH